MPGLDRDRVLALAALASSEADQDPIDAAIRVAASTSEGAATGRLVRFIPFDPATRTAEAFAVDREGRERIVDALEVAAGRIAAGKPVVVLGGNKVGVCASPATHASIMSAHSCSIWRRCSPYSALL